MILRRLLPLLAAAPLAAQSFADGPAFGGSLVFSEGLNPLGNAARYEKAGRGFALGYEDGDAKARGFADAGRDLDQGLRSGDALLQLRGLQGLAERPFALRRTAYGFSWAENGGFLLAYTRQEDRGLQLRPDADPARTGGGIAANQTQVQFRRTTADRIIFGVGGGGGADQPSSGVRMRLERLAWGQADPQPGLTFGPVNELLKEKIPTVAQATVVNFDAGYELPFRQNIRFGFTVDHLIPHRYWGGVEAKAQFRAGFELALSPRMALRVESDLNQAQRLPLPVDQRAAAASLRLDLGSALLQMGAERRTAAGQSWTTAGASCSFAFSRARLGFGFHFGDDRPQRAAAARFNG